MTMSDDDDLFPLGAERLEPRGQRHRGIIPGEYRVGSTPMEGLDGDI